MYWTDTIWNVINVIHAVFQWRRHGGKGGSSPPPPTGPVAWNGLPAHVRAIRDVIPFKSALKTHFFQLAYASSL